ncbi:MAG: hypothetical protein ABI806_05560 [Candidatus Solibacter sp.]
MRTFQLKSGANTFTLGVDGSVVLSEADAGKWSTSNDNQIVITNGAATTPIPVDWVWTPDNHLVIQQAGAVVFDVNGSTTSQPDFRLASAVLMVKPESESPFEFPVRPKWGLTKTHDLEMTVNGKASTIDGIISDTNSAFKFNFVDKKEIIEKFTLNFKGGWKDDPDEDDPARVIYEYDIAPDPSNPASPNKAVFKLPNKLVVDNNFNVLSYSYDKAGRTRSVALVGQFNVSQFEMSYAIERKSAADGVSTTLKFEINVKGSTQDGKLVFELKKKSGAAPETTLAIGGKYSAKFKSGVLTVAFGFKQKTVATLPTTRELTFSGSLVQASGTAFVWSFQMGSGKTEIMLGASDVMLGPVKLDSKVVITLQNGNRSAVTALLGFSF